MSNEEKIIKYFTKNYNKIGDDCAYLSQTKQLISSDTLVENIHFDLKYFTPKNIAHRLFTANYSDIQSSGGKPKYVLLNLSFPNKNFKNSKDEVLKLYDERFIRMWEAYLNLSELSFIKGENVIFQLVLTKKRDSFPLVRKKIN